MDQQKIVIRKVNKPISIDKKKFEAEAKKILKTVVIPQVKKASKIKNLDKERCINAPL